MTREITHMKAFTLALESLGKPRFSIGRIPPTPGLVNQYFNDSTGHGDSGEMDARGPWNEGDDWEFVTSPVVDSHENGRATGDEGKAPEMRVEHSERGDSGVLRELLKEELQDMLSAEGQILKALPKMKESAQSAALKTAFENHLEETKKQVDRLKDVFKMLGVTSAKHKVCKGMAGIIAEGEQLIQESKGKESVARDLAIIGAAQKVEHYEISAYMTARTMAQQLGESEIAQLLGKTLAEEENADSVLTDCARPLITEAKLSNVEQ